MVLGELNHIEPTFGLIAFIAVFVLLIIINYIVEQVQEWAEVHEYDEIVKIIFKELMTLGIVSFAIFLYEIGAPIDESFLTAFDVAHFTVFFIAIFFAVQAMIFMNLIHSQKKFIAVTERMSLEQLQSDFSKAKKSFFGSIQLGFPTWFPVVSVLQKQIEFKILGYYFMSLHGLPLSFHFSKYATAKFKGYVTSMGEISPIGWLFLSFLILLNYFKIRILDPFFTESAHGCHFPGPELVELIEETNSTSINATAASVISSFVSLAFSSSSSSDPYNHDYHRSLSSESTVLSPSEQKRYDTCTVLSLGFSVLCGFFLSFFFICLYIASCVYYERVLRLACNEDFAAKLDQFVQNTGAGVAGEAEESDGKGKKLKNKKKKSAKSGKHFFQSLNIEHDAGHHHSLFSLLASCCCFCFNFGHGHGHGGHGHEAVSTSDHEKAEKVGSMKINYQDQLNRLETFETKLLEAQEAVARANPNNQGDASHASLSLLSGELNKHSSKADHSKHLHEMREKHSVQRLPFPLRLVWQLLMIPVHFVEHMIHSFQTQHSGKSAMSDQFKMKTLFVNHSPMSYFLLLEICLLYQCFYAALWATQLLPIATNLLFHSSEAVPTNSTSTSSSHRYLLSDYSSFSLTSTSSSSSSHHNSTFSLNTLTVDNLGSEETQARWVIALTLPLVFTSLLMILILRHAAMIYTVLHLDSEITGEVVESQMIELKVREAFKKAVRERIINEVEIEEEHNPSFSHQKGHYYQEKLKEYFEIFDKDRSQNIDKIEFSYFLQEFSLFLSRERFKALWHSIDDDLSGQVNFYELFLLVFPEYSHILREELMIVDDIRRAVVDQLAKRRNPVKLPSQQFGKTLLAARREAVQRVMSDFEKKYPEIKSRKEAIKREEREAAMAETHGHGGEGHSHGHDKSKSQGHEQGGHEQDHGSDPHSHSPHSTTVIVGKETTHSPPTPAPTHDDESSASSSASTSASSPCCSLSSCFGACCCCCCRKSEEETALTSEREEKKKFIQDLSLFQEAISSCYHEETQNEDLKKQFESACQKQLTSIFDMYLKFYVPWLVALKEDIFSVYDADSSGSIDIDEFKLLLEKVLNIKSDSERKFKLLVQSIQPPPPTTSSSSGLTRSSSFSTTTGGSISWAQFVTLMLEDTTYTKKLRTEFQKEWNMKNPTLFPEPETADEEDGEEEKEGLFGEVDDAPPPPSPPPSHPPHSHPHSSSHSSPPIDDIPPSSSSHSSSHSSSSVSLPSVSLSHVPTQHSASVSHPPSHSSSSPPPHLPHPHPSHPSGGDANMINTHHPSSPSSTIISPSSDHGSSSSSSSSLSSPMCSFDSSPLCTLFSSSPSPPPHHPSSPPPHSTTSHSHK